MRALTDDRRLVRSGDGRAVAPVAAPGSARIRWLSVVSVVCSGITPVMALLQMGPLREVRWWGNVLLAVVMVPIPGLIGLVLATISLDRIDKTGQRGATIAVVGLNLGVACLFFAVMCWAAYGQLSRPVA